MKQIHIILVYPKIPSNSGNIIRLCANTGAKLHLVRPLGFLLDDKKLRRAGLDYHEWAKVVVHDDWATCKQALMVQNTVLFAMTTRADTCFYDADFASCFAQNKNIALVFGAETTGLDDVIRADIGQRNWLKLPMLPNSRSLNLSNSAAVALYEVWRQANFFGVKT